MPYRILVWLYFNKYLQEKEHNMKMRHAKNEDLDKIKMESRRYAKRQMTWFRKEKDYCIYNLSVQSETEIFEDILEKWESHRK